MQENTEKYATVSVYKFGKNGWRAQFPYKVDEKTWKRITRVLKTEGRDTKNGHKARDAAMKEAEELRKQMNEDALEPPENRMTVGECVERYIDSCTDIHRSTESSYRGMLKRHIAPKIGDKRLSDFSEKDAQTWVDWMGKHYARSVVFNSLRLLRAALNYASEEAQGWVPRNVARAAKPRKSDVMEQDRPNALTDGEYARVLSVVNTALQEDNQRGYYDLPHMLAIKIALLSGMRRAEICALRWRCVDFKENYVSVELSIGQTDREFYLKEPKSKSSRRIIECPAELMADLKLRYAAMMEQYQSARLDTTDNPCSIDDLYVIGGVDGSWMKPPRLDDHWRALSKTLALKGTQNKPVTFHCLRHTYATRLIQAGVDIGTIAALLGHSTPSITQDRYISTGSEAKRRAADLLGVVSAQTVAEYSGQKVLPMGKTGTED